MNRKNQESSMFVHKQDFLGNREMESQRSCNRSSKSFIFFFSILSCSLLPFCYAAGTITPGQSITGDQTITSASDNFVLGFFSPGNSTYHFIGIWYKKVSPLVFVWVANKDNPLPASSTGVLRFGEDGNINLLDEITGKIYWSTNTTVDGSQANSSIALLLDSGNFIIRRENRETYVWQSFDYPSDIFLPGMKIGLNLKTGQEWFLKSWVDINDPSFGGYFLRLDGENLNQLVITQRETRHWRSGPWNGERFDGVVEMKKNNMYNYSLIREGDEIYFTYSVYDQSAISLVMLDVTGKMQQLIWVEGRRTWDMLFARPGDQCEVYGLCGAFGDCKETSSGPSCSCLQGFQPQSPGNWISGNWSGGCSRKKGLNCGNVDKFLPVKGMRLPDRSRQVAASNLGDCEAKCISNCSCTAYALAGPDRCLVWDGSLMDLEELAVEGHDLFIRLDASEFDGTRKWVLPIIIVAATLGMFLLLSRTVFLWWRDAKDRGFWKKSKDLSLFDLGVRMPTSSKSTGDGNEDGPELPLFDFASVAAATEDFSYANKLGEGGFGPVYKGMLPNGQEIAVKRLSSRSGQGLEQFKNEVLLLSRLQHRNLVRVLGCCIQGEEKILIYEYMPNKSLDYFLFDPNKRAILDWVKSLHIVEGIAQGLLYLHQYSRLRIIHRDLKASNILLDGEMNPKISDFGMARIFGGNQTQENTNRVVGTYGYMAPEYALDGRFSVKSDVFSFGVLLLEIISGKRNNGFTDLEESQNLLGYAWKLWKGGRSLELLDPSLRDSNPTHEVLRCIHIGLLCVQEDAENRPTVSSIVLMLSSEEADLPEPKKPAFSFGKNPAETESSSGTPKSINEVTITVIEGR